MDQTMMLYHGSRQIITRPVFGKGNFKNDYGLGFYCTESDELAKEWACTEESDGYANRYLLNREGLSTLHLSGAEYHILNWLAVLLNNRTFQISHDLASEARAYMMDEFLPDISGFDIITGYRADDSYFSFANAFLNNSISLSQLGEAMHLGKLGEQVVLKSERAFDQIRYLGSEKAKKNVYYPKKAARDKDARAAYKTARDWKRTVDAVYMIDILRGRWKNDDPRIR